LKRRAARIAVRVLQWGVVLAILAYLFSDIYRNDSFAKFWDGPKRWDLLAAALGLTLAAVTITIVRWHWLIRALGLPFRLRDALRLGFLGYLLNFVSFGSVGGDLFKAVFVARELHGHRAEAVATVVVDRLIGLFGIFLLATASIVATGAWGAESSEQMRLLYRITFICTGVGGLAFAGLLLLPDAWWHAVEKRLGRLPRIGPICERLIAAVRRYRRAAWVLALALGATVVAQAMFAVGFYFVSAGSLEVHPSLASHMVIVPLAMLVGILPLPMSGLGAVEVAIDFMYHNVPRAVEGAAAALPAKGVGALVSLANRIVGLAVAMIGVGVYFASRREVAEVMHEVEVEEEQGHSLLDAGEDEPRTLV
jgi:glycosyltransferase 2 family protein